ncbi:MAG: Gfo/Idh/MocA family oxidoreductase [Candidatus Krumholzibacteria bacterium]|nr:Gfo/Idh/MocA family oxidoreductase [Candidatus Krumholzibacteria bacterium]
MGESRGLKAGVIGTGSLGNHHARIYASSDKVDEVFLQDSDSAKAEEMAERWGTQVCGSPSELLAKCDVVSICTPATVHHSLALEAFAEGVHVLVEKPLAASSAEGREMVEAAAKAGLVLQVGHIERFNGAFEAAAGLVRNPMFIECHRLGTFTPRGTDVSVVVDLMIHDIDLVLSLLEGDRLVELRASGANVLTGSPDIVNARLEFEGGCVANLTASRVSREPLRKMRFFEENLYVSADLRARSIEAFGKAADVPAEQLASDPMAFIKPIGAAVDDGEPLMKEIYSFIEAARGIHEPVVSGVQGLYALETAEMILERLRKDRPEG